MHKLLILFEPLEDWTEFENTWPEFLHLVETMPGLIKESSSMVEMALFGSSYARSHELYFDSLSSVKSAMASENGRAAGRLLQTMTGGRVTLLIADHHEDDMANIRKHQSKGPDTGGPDTGGPGTEGSGVEEAVRDSAAGKNVL